MAKASPRPLEELDNASRERITALTALQPHELSPSDRAFMRGRSAYLTEAQIADYAGEVEEVTDDEDSYANWTVAELREEAKARDLQVSSNAKKAELVAALEANDAE